MVRKLKSIEDIRKMKIMSITIRENGVSRPATEDDDLMKRFRDVQRSYYAGQLIVNGKPMLPKEK